MNLESFEKQEQARLLLASIAGRRLSARLAAVEDELTEDKRVFGPLHPCTGEQCRLEDPEAYRCRYHVFG